MWDRSYKPKLAALISGLLAVATLIGAVSLSYLLSESPANQYTRKLLDPKYKRFRNQVITAQSPQAKREAYRDLFSHLGGAGLEHLEKDSDIGIALQSCWERNAITQFSDQPPYEVLVPKHGERFLSKVRECIGFDPPEWWSWFVMNAVRTAQNGDMFFPAAYPVALPVPRGKPVDSQFGVLTFSSDSDSFYEIRCNGRSLAKVWGMGKGMGTGSTFRMSEVISFKRQIIVLGQTMDGIYLESFDANTGAPIFKFCSSYWIQWPEKWRFYK